MDKYKTFGFVVIATHWSVAVGHLFLAAKVSPAPNNHFSLVVFGMLILGHLAVSVLWWTLPNRPAGLILCTFFTVVLTFGIYEHFLHPGANNVFMVVPGAWNAPFEAIVAVLIALEILGAGVGFQTLRGQVTFAGCR